MSITFNQKNPIETDEYFIGIDQSMTHTGLTITKNDNIIGSYGFATTTTLTFEERILSIRSFILSKIEQFHINEVFISIEGLAFNRSPSNNSMMLFGLFTVIISELTIRGYRYKIVPPKTLKKFATEDGSADKELMLTSIDEIIVENLKDLSGVTSKKKFEDIVDSYWLAKYALSEKERI